MRRKFGADRLGKHQLKMLEVMRQNYNTWPGHYTLLFSDMKIMNSLIDRGLVVGEQLPGDVTVVYRIKLDALDAINGGS